MNKHEVDYLVIGGVAVIFHGYTRATADLDLWYKPTLNNLQKIINAFKEYGFDVSELEEAVFDPTKTFLPFPTPGFRTELLPFLAGDIPFDEAKAKADKIELDGVNVPIIGYDDLVRSKAFTNRLKDQADIEDLAKRKKRDGKAQSL